MRPMLKVVEKSGMIHLFQQPITYEFGETIVYVDKEETRWFRKDQISHSEWVPGQRTVIVHDIFI